MMKTRQDNDVIDRLDTIYVKNETELPCLIGLGIICDKNQIGQWHYHSIGLVYVKIETRQSRPI